MLDHPGCSRLQCRSCNRPPGTTSETTDRPWGAGLTTSQPSPPVRRRVRRRGALWCAGVRAGRQLPRRCRDGAPLERHGAGPGRQASSGALPGVVSACSAVPRARSGQTLRQLPPRRQQDGPEPRGLGRIHGLFAADPSPLTVERCTSLRIRTPASSRRRPAPAPCGSWTTSSPPTAMPTGAQRHRADPRLAAPQPTRRHLGEPDLQPAQRVRARHAAPRSRASTCPARRAVEDRSRRNLK